MAQSSAYLEAMKSLQLSLRELKQENEVLRQEQLSFRRERTEWSRIQDDLVEQLRLSRAGSSAGDDRHRLVARIHELENQLSSVKGTPVRLEYSQLLPEMTPLVSDHSRVQAKSLCNPTRHYGSASYTRPQCLGNIAISEQSPNFSRISQVRPEQSRQSAELRQACPELMETSRPPTLFRPEESMEVVITPNESANQPRFSKRSLEGRAGWDQAVQLRHSGVDQVGSVAEEQGLTQPLSRFSHCQSKEISKRSLSRRELQISLALDAVGRSGFSSEGGRAGLSQAKEISKLCGSQSGPGGDYSLPWPGQQSAFQAQFSQGPAREISRVSSLGREVSRGPVEQTFIQGCEPSVMKSQQFSKVTSTRGRQDWADCQPNKSQLQSQGRQISKVQGLDCSLGSFKQISKASALNSIRSGEPRQISRFDTVGKQMSRGPSARVQASRLSGIVGPSPQQRDSIADPTGNIIPQQHYSLRQSSAKQPMNVERNSVSVLIPQTGYQFSRCSGQPRTSYLPRQTQGQQSQYHCQQYQTVPEREASRSDTPAQFELKQFSQPGFQYQAGLLDLSKGSLPRTQQKTVAKNYLDVQGTSQQKVDSRVKEQSLHITPAAQKSQRQQTVFKSGANSRERSQDTQNFDNFVSQDQLRQFKRADTAYKLTPPACEDLATTRKAKPSEPQSSRYQQQPARSRYDTFTQTDKQNLVENVSCQADWPQLKTQLKPSGRMSLDEEQLRRVNRSAGRDREQVAQSACFTKCRQLEQAEVSRSQDQQRCQLELRVKELAQEVAVLHQNFGSLAQLDRPRRRYVYLPDCQEIIRWRAGRASAKLLAHRIIDNL